MSEYTDMIEDLLQKDVDEGKLSVERSQEIQRNLLLPELKFIDDIDPADALNDSTLLRLQQGRYRGLYPWNFYIRE